MSERPSAPMLKPGVDVLLEGEDVLTEEGAKGMSQSKGPPFSRHEAFMNRHLPPLLSIPLTTTSSLVLLVSQTLPPSFPHPLLLSPSYTLPVTHTNISVLIDFSLLGVCVFLSVPPQQQKLSVSPSSEPLSAFR